MDEWINLVNSSITKGKARLRNQSRHQTVTVTDPVFSRYSMGYSFDMHELRDEMRGLGPTKSTVPPSLPDVI